MRVTSPERKVMRTVAETTTVATGEIPVITGPEDEADYTPVVIRQKSFDAEWMTVEEAVDRMELVGHYFFLFIDARSDHPSVVYRRKGWDYGVIGLDPSAPDRQEEATAARAGVAS